MKRILIITAILGGLFLSSCDLGDDSNIPTSSTLTLDLSGLEALGPDFVYEGWLIVQGNPVSTGTFSDVTFPKRYIIHEELLNNASKFVLSIEPTEDSDPAPSNTKILAGDFSGNTAMVTTDILGDFSSSEGTYILATPTDGANNNENSGIWFLDLSTGAPTVGLSLPVLPEGWKYEGWVVIEGVPVTSGTFTVFDMVDEFDGYSSTLNPGPPFPGEDYLMNAPNNLVFPTDLSGGKAVISIEPYPDNSPLPFSMKPLVGDIPSAAIDHTPYTMGQNLGSMPFGSVRR